ncbi:LOW QUALITY PROTEIN: E3 ubiquitin-protein ligase UBR2 [Panulirus ornatus]|uniref:LOW QUALITY PROTEIN: E3 ubiquitin-protein ligase UBR2 n=1 Tax=Panulirus ornatus TaxID=150431 RepID=UPI003A87E67F
MQRDLLWYLASKRLRPDHDMMDPTVVDLVERWNALHKEGRFSALNVREYWRIKVPEIYSPQLNCNCLRITFDEELAQKLLFDPLERFMCGGDPAQVFQMVKQLDTPPSLCGRVFKNGDPTYGCRDCGMDPTCVLCAECFKNSAHSKHRYKISTSSGGGYCDCGDKEAWKSDVFCDIHVKGQMVQQSQNPLEKLPPDLTERIHLIFECILPYAKELLTYEVVLSIPKDLEIRESDREPTNLSSLYDIRDTYVTMLYNDETHTYDQVISTLERAIECTHKDAVAFATSIDREGRCIVRCSSFQQCSQTKSLMEKQTSRGGGRPLKVQVMDTYIIAHQIFASRLLTWLHNILESAQAFRLIFSDIVNKDGGSIVENIIWTDTNMWKTARVQWHRLFISGMLMDQESKKLFARTFTKHYSKMMKDFILDDHDHSVSVASLGVQLFTMPTIAHMLVAEEDVLARLLNTFLSECDKKLRDNKLALEHRSSNTSSFRRIQYILYDLKYLLGVKPEIWTDDLRRGFLHGYSLLLRLLGMMQGMDPMVRQVGTHMEYEPEWESAFNLHIKLAAVIPLVIEWAASDRIVLIKAYRLLMKSLGELGTEATRRRYVRELLDYSVSCIEYDVSSAPVSIHLPLSRLVAGLTLHLDRYGLNYNSPEFLVKGKPSPEELMEPVLRTQVMIAQVHAGMWRRNGFSLINQIYFYHNVRCRQEMLDRDVMLLQIAATLIDSNEFLVHLLNRFNLMNWARDDYEIIYLRGNDEDNMRQTVVLVEEYLQLVMTVVAERYTPGIGQVEEEDRIKKEIIQLLCIEPMPHSVLNKALPEGTNHETGMEKVIDEVADFKKSSGATKGYFDLKKAYYSHYNLFFYHYTREEQSKSEVGQRARKKAAGEEECCPPPVPPPFTVPFTMIVNILQCDVFLHIIKTVLKRMSETKAQSVSESQLQKVLHLIGYALHEEERYHRNSDPYFHFTRRAQKINLLALLEGLVGHHRTSTHKDLLAWTIRKYRVVLNLSSDISKPAHETEAVLASTSSSEASAASAEKKRRAVIATQRKARIMAKMASMQQNFIKTNETFFQETPSTEQPVDIPESTPMDLTERLPEDMIAIGPRQTLAQPLDVTYTCILCHQEDAVGQGDGTTGRPMVLGGLIQRSTVLSRNRTCHLEQPENHDPLLLPADLHWGVHTSSCGHAMHAQCWQKYFDDVVTKERRRPYRFRQNLSFDIEKSEYLCPLCESLCNTALPLLPGVTYTAATIQSQNPAPTKSTIPIAEWLKGLHTILKYKTVVMSGVRPDEEGSHQDDVQIDQTPQRGAVPTSGVVVAHGTVSLPATANSMGTGGSAPILVVGVTGGGGASINVGPSLLRQVQGEGGLRGRPPRWPRLPLNKKHKKGVDGKEEEEDYSSCAEGIWTPPTLPTVAVDLMSVSSPEAAEAFTDLFNNPAATTMPTFPSQTSDMMSSFAHAVYMHGLGVNPNFSSRRIPLMVWDTAAYTIHTLEETQRNASRALLTSLSSRQRDCLAALVKFAAHVPLCVKKKQNIEGAVVRLLSVLLEGGETTPCVLEWDAFSILVTLSLGLPSVFPNIQGLAIGSVQDLHLLQVCFLAHLVQLLLTYEEQSTCTEMKVVDKTSETNQESSSSTGNGDAAWLASLLVHCRTLANLPAVNVEPQNLLDYVKESCLPFLRCCGLFFHFLTEVPAPEELQSSVWVPESEFYCLLRYLGLAVNHLKPTFSDPGLLELVNRWCSDSRVGPLVTGAGSEGCVRSWTRINQLVSLPHDYSELINTVSQFPCPASSGDDSRTPTMCLVCGKMLCSQSYCCQTEFPEGSHQMVGACTYHAHHCGAGTGIFLRVRECKILLLSGRIKGCFVNPPYLDEYGETDQGLKRGNPLHLDATQYARLHTMWLSHAIPDTIAHTMESNSSVLATEWQHL